MHQRWLIGLLAAACLLAAGLAGALGALAGPPALIGAIVGALGIVVAFFLNPVQNFVTTLLGGKQKLRETLRAQAQGVDSHGRLPKVCDNRVDALKLGVNPAADLKSASVPPTAPHRDHRLPVYIRRDQDEELDAAIEQGGLVIIQGPSATGKTRTAYEAIRRSEESRSLLIPRGPDSFSALIEAGWEPRDLVIWLDDLERFLVPG